MMPHDLRSMVSRRWGPSSIMSVALRGNITNNDVNHGACRRRSGGGLGGEFARMPDGIQPHLLVVGARNHVVDILPIITSRTCTPHSSTITSLTSLLTLRTRPHDKLISRTRMDTTRLLAQLHLHTVQWLHNLLLVYRIKSRTTTRRTSTHRTHTRPLLKATTLTHVTLPGGE
jgi:hypothetical protein